MEAAEKLESRGPRRKKAKNACNNIDEHLFIHLQYHPHDLPRREIRRLYEEHCGELFSKKLGIKQPTIAYSRLHTIAEYCTQARLHEPPEYTSETIMGELQG